jgi:hypothetical protein
MKIVAKTDSGYLCSLTMDEVCLFANGHAFPSSSRDKMDEIDVYKLKTDTEINMNALFRKLRDLQGFKTKGEDWDSVRHKLQNLLDALSPVEGYIKEVQAQLKA